MEKVLCLLPERFCFLYKQAMRELRTCNSLPLALPLNRSPLALKQYTAVLVKNPQILLERFFKYKQAMRDLRTCNSLSLALPLHMNPIALNQYTDVLVTIIIIG